MPCLRAGPAWRLACSEVVSSGSNGVPLPATCFRALWLLARSCPSALSTEVLGSGPFPDPGNARKLKSSIMRPGPEAGNRPSGSSIHVYNVAMACQAALFWSLDISSQFDGGHWSLMAGISNITRPLDQSLRPAQRAGQLPVSRSSIADGPSEGNFPSAVSYWGLGARGAWGSSCSHGAGGMMGGPDDNDAAGLGLGGNRMSPISSSSPCNRATASERSSGRSSAPRSGIISLSLDSCLVQSRSAWATKRLLSVEDAMSFQRRRAAWARKATSLSTLGMSRAIER